MNYTKNPIKSEFYHSLHTPKNCDGYIIFVHGGPGIHSAYFEYLLSHVDAYEDLNYGWICYDQRGCGRTSLNAPISHHQNIEDLGTLYELFSKHFKIKALFGHSYGSRLVLELAQKTPQIEAALIIAGRGERGYLSPERMLMMNLLCLKAQHSEEYQKFYETLSNWKESFEGLRLAVWDFAKPLSLDKTPFYWGNLEAKAFYDRVKKEVDLPENDETFQVILRQMENEGLNDVDYDFESLDQRVLWIQGLHDVMQGGDQIKRLSRKKTLFLGSGHYPHIEEPERFVNEINQFLS